MSIIVDGGLWNENISELQAALNALGADPVLRVTGTISNTSLHELQRTANALGATPQFDEDGGLGNDAIRELQLAVAALQGGAPLVDLSTALFDINERELDGGTQVEHIQGQEQTANTGIFDSTGTFDLVVGAPVNDSATFDMASDPSVWQGLIEGLLGASNVQDFAGTSGFGFEFVLVGDFLTGDHVDFTIENNATAPLPVTTYSLLDAAVLASTQTVVPDQTANGNDMIAGDGGRSDAALGFVVGSDEHGSTLTAVYDNDSAMWIPGVWAESDDRTLYVVWIPGDEYGNGDLDSTETCPIGFDEDDQEGYYLDAYGVADDPVSSLIDCTNLMGSVPPPHDDARQFGAPQASEAILLTIKDVGSDGSGLFHIDGPAMDPQTLRPIAFYGPGYGGLLVGNYTGGGYCAPGRWCRILGFDTGHSDAEDESVRDQIIAYMASVGVTITKREKAPPPEPIVRGDVVGVVTDESTAPLEGVTVVVRDSSPYNVLGTYLATATTNALGEYTLATADLDVASVIVWALPPDSSYSLSAYGGSPTTGLGGLIALSEDGSPVTADIEMLPSIDPQADSDTTDLWNVTDAGSLILTGDEVDEWANQMPARPSFIAGLGGGSPTKPQFGTRMVGGVNAIDFVQTTDRLIAENTDLDPDDGYTVIFVGIVDATTLAYAGGAVLSENHGNRLVAEVSQDPYTFINVYNNNSLECVVGQPCAYAVSVTVAAGGEIHAAYLDQDGYRMYGVTDVFAPGILPWADLTLGDAGAAGNFDGAVRSIQIIAGIKTIDELLAIVSHERPF